MLSHPLGALLYDNTMSNLDGEAILALLRSTDEVNHELAFQLLENLGLPAGLPELAVLISKHPDYLWRALNNDWEALWPHIRRIDFQYHNFSHLHQHFCKLVGLEYCSISHCHLTELPQEVGCLQQLQRLLLNYNALKALPDSFAQLQQLLELSLVGNQFKTLPAVIFELPQLETLSLIDNYLHTLPKGLVRLQNLRKLILRNNHLRDLPIEVCWLENLEILDLSENRLERLPNSLSALRRLKILYLSRNPLSKSEQEKIRNILPQTVVYI